MLKISVLCVIAAVSCADGMMIRRWTGAGRLIGRKYFPETYYTTTETEETATEQFYEKESGYYAHKQQESVEKIFILSDNALNWTEARSACLESGRMLANPSTREQREQLKSYIRDNNLLPPDVFSGYWLGGHREDNSGPFKWENGEEVIQGGYNAGWMWGEPNFDGENCVELKSDSGDLGFNNFYCHLYKRYICEEILSQEHAKNIHETNNKEVHEEENKNLAELTKFDISDSDEFGTIIVTPRNDLSEEVDTESPLAYETSDYDQFGTILMAPKKVVSDTESPLVFETDHDQFDTVVVVPKNIINDEVDPWTSEYDQFGTIVVVPPKISSEEVDTGSPISFETLEDDEFTAPEKVISDEIDTESPLKFETLDDIIMASKNGISEEIDSDEFGTMDIKLPIVYNNSDASILRKTMEPGVVDSDESRLIGLISGVNIVAKTESPIDTMRLDDPFSSKREVENDETVAEISDPDVIRKFGMPEDVQTETSEGLIIPDNQQGDIESENPGIPMVFDYPGYGFAENVGTMDDYYGDFQNVDNWGLDNDEYEQE